MAIRILTQNSIENTNIDGARDNHFNAGMRSGIVKGTYNEGKLFTPANNIISLDTCELRICGHRIVIDDPISIEFANKPSVDIRYSVIAKISMERMDFNPTFTFEVKDANLPLEQSNFYDAPNSLGHEYELELGRFTLTKNLIIEDLVETGELITGGIGAGSGDGELVVQIGEVYAETLSAGANAEVNVTSDDKGINFAFYIPRGEDGEKGEKGNSFYKSNEVKEENIDTTFLKSEFSIDISDVHTGDYIIDGSGTFVFRVYNVDDNLIYVNKSFTIKGVQGVQGERGVQGIQGETGRGIYNTSETLNSEINSTSYISPSSLSTIDGETEFIVNSLIIDNNGTVAIGKYSTPIQIIAETLFSVKGEQGIEGKAGEDGLNGRSVFLTSYNLSSQSVGTSLDYVSSLMINNPVPVDEFAVGSIIIDRNGTMAVAKYTMHDSSSSQYSIYYEYITSLKGEQGKVGATFTYDENTKTLTINTEV